MGMVYKQACTYTSGQETVCRDNNNLAASNLRIASPMRTKINQQNYDRFVSFISASTYLFIKYNMAFPSLHAKANTIWSHDTTQADIRAIK